jgi:hypothetical protein
MEMRQAARAVALENSQLRSLLASRGVAREHVDQYLASAHGRASRTPPTAASAPRTDEVHLLPPVAEPELPRQQLEVNGGPPCDLQTTTRLTCEGESELAALQHESDAERAEPGSGPGVNTDRDMDKDMIPDSDGYRYDNASASALDTLAAAVAHGSEQQSCCGGVTQCSLPDSREGPERRAEPSPSSGWAPGGPKSPTMTHSHAEMSCTAAARIMVNMLRDGDEELARESLGCAGPEECTVRNTTLFELLDR